MLVLLSRTTLFGEDNKQLAINELFRHKIEEIANFKFIKEYIFMSLYPLEEQINISFNDDIH